MINAIAQEMFKMFVAQQKGNGWSTSNNKMSNFTGMILPSNVLSFYLQNDKKNTWLIDSGASDHMCGNEALFCEMRDIQNPVKVGVPDGSMKIVDKITYVKLSDKLMLYDVLFISQFKPNLLFVSKLIQANNLNMLFDKKNYILQDSTSKEVVG